MSRLHIARRLLPQPWAPSLGPAPNSLPSIEANGGISTSHTGQRWRVRSRLYQPINCRSVHEECNVSFTTRIEICLFVHSTLWISFFVVKHGWNHFKEKQGWNQLKNRRARRFPPFERGGLRMQPRTSVQAAGCSYGCIQAAAERILRTRTHLRWLAAKSCSSGLVRNQLTSMAGVSEDTCNVWVLSTNTTWMNWIILSRCFRFSAVIIQLWKPRRWVKKSKPA